MSLFQKRHYEWLAAFVRTNCSPANCINMRNALARDNPKFDADKFDRASGAAEYLAGVAALTRSVTP
jgi:hypothetical protein